jgi:hypothetical protein
MQQDIKINEKWFLFAIIVLGIHLLWRLIDQSKMMFEFPLDYTNDYSGHMAMLFFLAKVGFHKIAPYWYNGYTVFKSYPPGWAFFTYPLYKLTSNILVATFTSVIALFSLSFITIALFFKKLGISFTKAAFFFLLIFANPIFIGNFIRLGKVPELYGWFIFTLFALFILYYKDRVMDKKFLVFILLYALLMFSYMTVIILAHLLLLGFFITRKARIEQMYIIGSVVMGLILSAFWWLPYLLSLLQNNILAYKMSYQLLHFSGQWLWTSIASFVVAGGFLIIFFLFWKNKEYSRREMIFYSPMILLSLLIITRLIVFVPILNNVYPDSEMIFLIFFTAYFLVTLKNTHKTLKIGFLIALILIPIAMVSINFYHTPKFIGHAPLTKDVLNLLPQIEGRFLMEGKFSNTAYSKAVYSYGPIYLNLSTPSGWSHSENSPEYITKLLAVPNYLTAKDCTKLTETLDFLNTTSLITIYESCDFLKSCNYTLKNSSGDVCLYIIN